MFRINQSCRIQFLQPSTKNLRFFSGGVSPLSKGLSVRLSDMLSSSSEKIWASAPQNPKQKCKSTLLLQSINWSDASTQTQIVLFFHSRGLKKNILSTKVL